MIKKIIIEVESDADDERIKYFITKDLISYIHKWGDENFQKFKSAKVSVEDA